MICTVSVLTLVDDVNVVNLSRMRQSKCLLLLLVYHSGNKLLIGRQLWWSSDDLVKVSSFQKYCQLLLKNQQQLSAAQETN